MADAATVCGTRYLFPDLKALLAKATPRRSGDLLAGIAAADATARVAAQLALPDLPLRAFLNEAVIPYEANEVMRLILDTHDAMAFAAVAARLESISITHTNRISAASRGRSIHYRDADGWSRLSPAWSKIINSR